MGLQSGFIQNSFMRRLKGRFRAQMISGVYPKEVDGFEMVKKVAMGSFD